VSVNVVSTQDEPYEAVGVAPLHNSVRTALITVVCGGFWTAFAAFALPMLP